MPECLHVWVLDRPESDTWECLDCGADALLAAGISIPPGLPTQPTDAPDVSEAAHG